MSIPIDIEEQLRQAILGAAMTRADLSRATGVSEGILSRFVRCERTLRLDTAAKVAAALGLRLTDESVKAMRAAQTGMTARGSTKASKRRRSSPGKRKGR